MASSKGKVHSNAAKEQQLISQFFNKTLHTILESRAPYMSSRNYSGDEGLSSPSSSPALGLWSFRIALRECPAVLESTDFCRQSNHELMVVDVILVRPSLDLGGNPPPKEQVHNVMNLERGGVGRECRQEKIIERWAVQYQSRKSKESAPWCKKFLLTSYKKLIVLLRSLYVRMRLLPAYKLFRDLISCGKIRKYALKHRVSSFVEPFTHREEADMQQFSFTPVDTLCGRLFLSVSYRASLSDVSSEPSTPMSPQFMPDYIGSPLADPLKSFPSLPCSYGFPSCSPFSRRHSWSLKNHHASSPLNLASPSPASSDPHNSISKYSSPLALPVSSPHQLPERFQDDASKALLRCEIAPVGIPTNQAFNNQNLLPYFPLKLTKAATFKSNKCAGVSSAEKLSIKGDESGRFTGVMTSSLNSSLQIPLRRSSSRLSIQDDFDDSEFPCHFVDDADTIDPSNRTDSFDQKGHLIDPHKPKQFGSIGKSQDAEVGALVLMLRKAPPLCQDTLTASRATSCSKNEKLVQKFEEQQSQEGSGSRYPLLKTTADALVELQGHKELKDWLLSQGNKSLGSPGAKAK